MSSTSIPSSPPSQPRRRRRWWIALAMAVPVVVGGYWFFGLIYRTASFMVGRPHLPGCTAAIAKEASVGELWYRISTLGCSGHRTMYYVFVAPARAMTSFMVSPAFMSVDGPVPVAMGQTGERTYFIRIAPPLPDGIDTLDVVIGAAGLPAEMLVFDHGKKRDLR